MQVVQQQQQHNVRMQVNGSQPDSGIAAVENGIHDLLEALLELGVCTSDVQPTALEASSRNDQDDAPSGVDAPGGLVGKKVQDTIQAMSQLFDAHTKNEQARGLLLPAEVIDYVDQGRNPDLYSREIIERVAGENMYTNGILDAIGSYRDILAQEMRIAFPTLKATIDSLEAASQSV